MLNALIKFNSYKLNGVKLISTIHDEIILECENTPEDVGMAISKLCEAMIMGYQDVFPKGLTNKLVNIGHGPNWAEAK